MTPIILYHMTKYCKWLVIHVLPEGVWVSPTTWHPFSTFNRITVPNNNKKYPNQMLGLSDCDLNVSWSVTRRAKRDFKQHPFTQCWFAFLPSFNVLSNQTDYWLETETADSKCCEKMQRWIIFCFRTPVVWRSVRVSEESQRGELEEHTNLKDEKTHLKWVTNYKGMYAIEDR